jgi:hypothetical protein
MCFTHNWARLVKWDLLWLLRAAHGTTEKSAAQQRLSPVVEELLPCL